MPWGMKTRTAQSTMKMKAIVSLGAIRMPKECITLISKAPSNAP